MTSIAFCDQIMLRQKLEDKNTMLAKPLCQNYFHKSLTSIHAKRANALFETSWSLTKDATLTVTNLGRHKEGAAYVKNKIKSVDRLFGNKKLQKELLLIYREFYEPILKNLPIFYIAVDWSGCCSSEHHMLRASLLYHGRGIPIYTEVHSQANVGNRIVHKTFLANLKKILPFGKAVVIVTDAGFATPWFHEIIKQGWDYVGRINRNTAILLEEADDEWIYTDMLELQASGQVKYIGEGRIGKKSKTPVIGHVYTYKEKYKHRKGTCRFPEQNERNARAQRKPWILVTSLPFTESSRGEVRNIYKRRMQIEQNFRDDKNPRLGFGWRFARVYNTERLPVFCLIASIATFFLWWIGLTAEKIGLHRRFQANSIRTKRVLSFLFLAKQLIYHMTEKIEASDFHEAALQFSNQYEAYILCDYVQ